MQLPSDRPIVIGGDMNFPPYEFLDEKGRPAGYNVDLTKAIAREMGLNIVIRLGRWQERVQALEAGKIDALMGMFYSPERGSKYNFSPSHSVGQYIAVVRKGDGPAPVSVDELAKKHIVVQGEDILHDFAQKNGLENQTVTVKDQEVALSELSKGKHDCALVSRITALYLIDKNKWQNLELGQKGLFIGEYGYATQKDQKALLTQFSEGLNVLEKNGEYHRINDKWFGIYKNESDSFLAYLRLAAIVIAPLLLIFLIILLWSWSLRRQVREKTLQLRESLDRFQYFFESSNIGKSVTYPSGKMDVNRAFANFLGYTCEELNKKSWQEITPQVDIQGCEEKIAPLLTGHKDSVRFEKRYLHKNGSCLWADVSARIRRDQKFKPIYFITTIVDITERKQTQKQLKNYTRQLELLHKIDQAILEGRPVDDLAQEVCQGIPDIVPMCQRVSIAEFHSDLKTARILAVLMKGERMINVESEVPLEQFGNLEKLRKGQAHVVNDVRLKHSESIVSQTLESEGMRSYANIPMVAEGQLIGTLNIAADETDGIKETDLDILGQVAKQMAIAIKHQQLRNEKLQYKKNL